VKRATIAWAVLCAVISSAHAAESSQPASVLAAAETPAVARFAEIAQASHMRLLVYVERDDAKSNGGMVGFEVVGKLQGSNALVSPPQTVKAELIKGVVEELKTSGLSRISIVTEDGMVTVLRGPSPGPITGYTQRMRAEIDRVFPGHSKVAE
jgi:hypothetical protein